MFRSLFSSSPQHREFPTFPALHPTTDIFRDTPSRARGPPARGPRREPSGPRGWGASGELGRTDGCGAFAGSTGPSPASSGLPRRPRARSRRQCLGVSRDRRCGDGPGTLNRAPTTEPPVITRGQGAPGIGDLTGARHLNPLWLTVARGSAFAPGGRRGRTSTPVPPAHPLLAPARVSGAPDVPRSQEGEGIDRPGLRDEGGAHVVAGLGEVLPDAPDARGIRGARVA